MTRSRRFAKLSTLSAGAVLTAAALTGCGSLNPGAAAVVGSHSISDERVDDVALALCSASGGGDGAPAQSISSRSVRKNALNVLLETELSRQFGEKEGVEADQSKVSAALAQNEAGIASLPEDQQESFRKALRGFAEGQLMLIEVGRESLASQGKADATEEEAIAEGARLRSDYVKSIDVEVDPRFGEYGESGLTDGGNELSVAVSDRSADGASAQPSQGWVNALPAAQKCS